MRYNGFIILIADCWSFISVLIVERDPNSLLCARSPFIIYQCSKWEQMPVSVGMMALSASRWQQPGQEPKEWRKRGNARGQYSGQEGEAESERDSEKDTGKERKVSHEITMLFSDVLGKIIKS